MKVPLRLEAPAKLNLSLRVVGRRDDGYHLLESELVLLDLADRLLLLPGCSGLRLEGEGAGNLPLDDRNLAWRGLRAGLAAEPDLACLTLEKRVPVAAGLGGGSSDAAAGWRLGRVWRGASEGATEEDLAALGQIGADVPFFAARAAAARVSGIGEQVDVLPPVDRYVLLVHPPFGLATRRVFAELRPDEWGRGPNDLLAPALRLRPEIGDLLEAVRRAGAEAHMTGSGPTLFVLSDDAERATALARALAGHPVRVTISRTRTVPAGIERIEGQEQEE